MKNSNKAIKNYIYFTSNYPHDFIEKCFGTGTMGVHLKSKFNGDVNKFFRELDNENQVKLLDWIYQNYNGIGEKF